MSRPYTGNPKFETRIPSGVTPAELMLLQDLARGCRVLEVGSLLGNSTIALAQTAHHVVSVDPHEGYPWKNPRPTLVPFIDNLNMNGVRDKVTVMVGTDEDVLPWLRPVFNMIFLDLDGTLETTYRVLGAAYDLLVKPGKIVVHDMGLKEWPGAEEAVKEWSRDRDIPFHTVERCAVFACNPDYAIREPVRGVG